VLSLPEEYIIDSDGMTKAILRRALRGMVPAAILERRDKIGFATPERSWLVRLGDWVEQILSAHSPASQSILRREELLREWREVVAGRRDYDLHIWRWINLIRWAQRFEISFHE
jgi:asparagine synthase (glutamine-hydrolysing)